MAIYKSDGVDAVNLFPSKFITVFCVGTVAVGDVVELDFSATRSTNQTVDAYGISVKKAAATDNLPFACGVACEAITSLPAGVTGFYIKIQYAGYCNTVTPDAGIAVGLPVGTDLTTAGRIQAFTGNVSATAGFFGVVVDAYVTGAGTNDGAIFLIDKGFFNA